MFTIMSPVGPYYPEGFKPVTLYATSKYQRAWPGGTGNTKIGGCVLGCASRSGDAGPGAVAASAVATHSLRCVCA